MKRLSVRGWLACACVGLFFIAGGKFRNGHNPVSSYTSRSVPVYENPVYPVQASYPISNLYLAPGSHYAAKPVHVPFSLEQNVAMNRLHEYQHEYANERFYRTPQTQSQDSVERVSHEKSTVDDDKYEIENSRFSSSKTFTHENNLLNGLFHSSARSESYFNDDGSQFYSNDFGAGTVYSFSNDDKWNREDQFSTITTVSIREEYYIIGRGSCGIRIVKVGNHGVELVNDCDIPFSNEKHWDRRTSYKTIKAEVVNDQIYVIGRGSCGMFIYKVVGNSVEEVSVCEIPFSDSNNWDKDRYYTTIQTAVALGDLYIMGRGVCGMHIYKLEPDERVSKVSECDIPFSDYNGWAKESSYATITSTVLHEHIYILGRNLHGMVVYRTVEGNKVELVSNEEIEFSDANDWYYASRYRTIQAHADSEGIFVLGRGRKGVIVYKLWDDKAKLISDGEIPFSNGRGWATFSKYSTIGSTVVNDELYVWGLESCGLKIYKVSRSGSADLVSDCKVPFSQSNYFGSSSCYRTIRGARSRNGLVITGRTYCGMSVYDMVESKIRMRAICV